MVCSEETEGEKPMWQTILHNTEKNKINVIRITLVGKYGREMLKYSTINANIVRCLSHIKTNDNIGNTMLKDK